MMFAELAGIHGDIHPQDGAAFINFYFQGNVVNTVLYLIWFVALWFPPDSRFLDCDSHNWLEQYRLVKPLGMYL